MVSSMLADSDDDEYDTHPAFDQREDGPGTSSDEDDEDQEDQEDGDENDEDEDEVDVDPYDQVGEDEEEEDQTRKAISSDFSRLMGTLRDTSGTVGGDVDTRAGGTWDNINISIEDAPEEQEQEQEQDQRQDQVDAFRDDLRGASGIGKQKRKPGRKRRTWNEPILSQQVKDLIGRGSQAYVDQKLDVAIAMMQEAIRIEPRASAAWSILIACHRDLGNVDNVLRLGILSAHLNGDYEQWWRLAEESKKRGYLIQAVYCYRKASQVDPTSVDADWERASLARQMRDNRTAKSALMTILRRCPHEVTVLTELRPILIDMGELVLCQKIYASAFEYYRNLYPSGKALVEAQLPSPQGQTGPETASTSASTSTSAPQPPPPAVEELAGGGFDDFHIYVLADLYNMLGEHEKAIHTIRSGMRWLQGRGAQRVWDSVGDDREYDSAEMVRSPGDGSGGGGGASAAGAGGEAEEMSPGRYPLDVNARHRLAIARLKLGDVEEAKLHIDVVLACNSKDYAALFQEIADAYFERDMYTAALPLYEDLGSDPETNNMHVLLQVAACRRHNGDLKGAAEVYEQVIINWPEDTESKMKLAEVYEISGEPRKALQLVYQVIDARKRKAAKGASGGTDQAEQSEQQQQEGTSTSLFAERPSGSGGNSSKAGKGKAAGPRLTPAQLRAFEKERQDKIDHSYKRCEELLADMLAGSKDAEADWLIEAEKLVEHFRSTKQLFPAAKVTAFSGLRPVQKRVKKNARDKDRERENERDAEDLASRLQLEIEADSTKKDKLLVAIEDGKLKIFRGIRLEDWLTLILRYSFTLTKRDLYGIACEVLKHVRLSVVFQEVYHQDSIRLALIACAIHTKDYETITDQCRALINTHQFNNEAFRILQISMGSGLRATEAFIDSRLQKHFLREIRTCDAIVNDGKDVRWNAPSGRYSLREDKDEDDGESRKVTAKNDSEPKKQKNPFWEKPALPTKPNPVHLILYGLLCASAKSYQSAIFYLLQGFDYHNDDPVCCLSLGITCIGRAMQRQADNRHFMIVQGFAYISRYRTLRGGDEKDIDEIEYNLARAYQQLGLRTYAVKHYEKVLQMAEDRLIRGEEDVGLAREAAYNLSIIFVTTGATKLAESLYRKWLSI